MLWLQRFSGQLLRQAACVHSGTTSDGARHDRPLRAKTRGGRQVPWWASQRPVTVTRPCLVPQDSQRARFPEKESRMHEALNEVYVQNFFRDMYNFS